MPELQLRGGEVDGLRLNYVVEGRGPAVILVHGLGGFAESWRHNIRPLAGRATVYALDLPGFGDSAKPRTRYRLPDFSRAPPRLIGGPRPAPAAPLRPPLRRAGSATFPPPHPAPG